jgi:hypothetical protein
MVWQWCYSGVTIVLQWCYNGVTAVLQWWYHVEPAPLGSRVPPHVAIQPKFLRKLHYQFVDQTEAESVDCKNNVTAVQQ